MDDFESPIWGTKRDFWSTFCQFYKLACVINTKPISAPFPSFSFLYYYTENFHLSFYLYWGLLVQFGFA